MTRFGKYAEYFDEIILQSVEGYFAGKDTKVWLAEKDSLNETKFKYTLQPDVSDLFFLKLNIPYYFNDRKNMRFFADYGKSEYYLLS